MAKKKVKAMFNALLDKSVKSDWEALEKKLQPQNFSVKASDSVPLAAPKRSHKRFAYAASAFVMIIAVVSIVAALKVSQNNAGIVKQITGSKNNVITSAVQNKSSSINISTVASSVASSQQTSAVSAPVSTVGGSSAVINLPCMPAEPHIINYKHRLYITRSVFDFEKTKLRNKLIGYIAFGKKIPAYSIKKESVSKSICLLSTYDQSKNYLKYNYLCNDSFKIQSRVYRITSAYDVNRSSKAKANTGKSTPNDYSMNLQIYYQFNDVKELLNKKIGKLSARGTVYSIHEINPLQAVYLNVGENWFLIQKAHGYAGKTIDDVMKDKGITPTAIN